MENNNFVNLDYDIRDILKKKSDIFSVRGWISGKGNFILETSIDSETFFKVDYSLRTNLYKISDVFVDESDVWGSRVFTSLEELCIWLKNYLEVDFIKNWIQEVENYLDYEEKIY